MVKGPGADQNGRGCAAIYQIRKTAVDRWAATVGSQPGAVRGLCHSGLFVSDGEDIPGKRSVGWVCDKKFDK